MKQNNLTDKEFEVAKALENLTKVSRRAHQRLNDAVANLGKECTHPAEYVVTYCWEHDDGYGTQTNLDGLRCLLCFRLNPWKRPNW